MVISCTHFHLNNLTEPDGLIWCFHQHLKLGLLVFLDAELNSPARHFSLKKDLIHTQPRIWRQDPLTLDPPKLVCPQILQLMNLPGGLMVDLNRALPVGKQRHIIEVISGRPAPEFKMHLLLRPINRAVRNSIGS